MLQLKLGLEIQVDIDGIDFSEIDAKYTALPATKTVDGEDAEKLSTKGKTTNAGMSSFPLQWSARWMVAAAKTHSGLSRTSFSLLSLHNIVDGTIADGKGASMAAMLKLCKPDIPLLSGGCVCLVIAAIGQSFVSSLSWCRVPCRAGKRKLTSVFVFKGSNTHGRHCRFSCKPVTLDGRHCVVGSVPRENFDALPNFPRHRSFFCWCVDSFRELVSLPT